MVWTFQYPTKALSVCISWYVYIIYCVHVYIICCVHTCIYHLSSYSYMLIPKTQKFLSDLTEWFRRPRGAVIVLICFFSFIDILPTLAQTTTPLNSNCKVGHLYFSHHAWAVRDTFSMWALTWLWPHCSLQFYLMWHWRWRFLAHPSQTLWRQTVKTTLLALLQKWALSVAVTLTRHWMM